MKNIVKLIEVLKKINTGTNLTKSEIDELNGFGAMSFLLRDWDDRSDWSKSEQSEFQYMPELKNQLSILSDKKQIKYLDLQDDMRNAVLSSYYTPSEVVGEFVNVLRGFSLRTGEEFKNILEPSVGSGRFLESLHTAFPDASIEAIEKNSISAMVAQENGKLISDSVKVYNNVYEALPYEKTYDLIVSNIPFAKVNVYDSKAPKQVKEFSRSLHEFYFAKSLALLRPGGVMAFITTTGIMDSDTHVSLREHMVRNANLISAVRLPDNVFAGENTRVATDIIMLQKKESKRRLLEYEKLFIQSPKVDLFSQDVSVNPYYLTYGSNIIGELKAGNQYSFSSGSTVVDTRGSMQTVAMDMANVLNTNILAYSQALYSAQVRQPVAVSVATELSLPLEDTTPHYSAPEVYLEVGERVGNYVYREENGNTFYLKIHSQFDAQAKGYPYVELSPNSCITGRFREKENLMSLLINLRSTSLKILQYKSKENLDGDVSELQKELNFYYDEIVTKTSMPLTEFLRKSKYGDVDVSFIAALEVYENGKYRKADIFHSPFVQEEEYRTDSLWDSIIYSYNKTGGVDAELCADALQISVSDFTRQSLEQNYLRYDLVTESLCLPNAFLSGDIRQKIKAHNRILDGAKPEFLTGDMLLKQLRELEAVLPIKVPVENIRPALGEMMFSTKLYEEFWGHYLGWDEGVTKGNLEIKRSDTAIYKVLVNPNVLHDINEKLQVKTRGKSLFTGIDMIEAVLNNEAKTFTYKDADDNTHPDYAANNEFVSKKERIKVLWQEYYMTNEKVREYLENTYYDAISFLPKKADGQYLKYDELAKIGITPYSYQLDGCAMLMENNGGLEHQPTGGGKTITMIMTAMKLKQCGIAKKPMICGLIANIEEIYQTAKKIYPHAKILYADKRSFKDRRAFFAKIANNDWDLVLMSHSQLVTIPQHKESVIEILREELKNIDDAIRFINGIQESALTSRLTKRQLKGLEIRKENKTTEIDRWLRITDDTVIDILKMGIDHIMIDEAHLFKNLSYTTRHRNIAGLNPTGSARAGLLYMNARAIRNRYYDGREEGLTFVTATPIQNYVAEQYTLDRFFNLERLKRQGIAHFDAYMHTFFDVSTTIELTVTNRFANRTRIRGYVKLDLLRKMAREYTHIVPKAEMEQHVKNLPKANMHHINIPRNEAQKQYLYDVLEFVSDGDRFMIQRNPDRKDADGAEMLLACTCSNKASIDMRFVDPFVYNDYCEQENTKVNMLCKEVANIYYQENDKLGTQLIFSNEGVPGGKNFNMYQAIKDTLVNKYNIASDEIQFVHDFDTDATRDTLRNKVNEGQVRVVLGSTQKLGTGINYQKRLKALHNIDIPWRPCDFDQRIGRGVRPGNSYDEVDIFFYTTLETPDAARFEILKNKQIFIKQISECVAFDGNSIEETAADANDIDYTKMMALVTGNETVKRLVGVTEEYNKHTATLYNKTSDYNRAKRTLTDSETEVERYSTRIEKIKQAIDVIGPNMPDVNDTVYLVSDGNNREYSPKEFGDFVNKLVEQNTIRKVTDIATFGDKFVVQLLPPNYNGKGYTIQAGLLNDKKEVTYTITYDRGAIAKTALLCGENPIKAIHNLPIALNLNKDKLERHTKALGEAKTTLASMSLDEINQMQEQQVTLAQELSGLKNQLEKETASMIDPDTRIKYFDIKQTTFTEAQNKLHESVTPSKNMGIVM